MSEDYKNYPFYDWVPKPIGIIFMIILFVPMITMSGVYSANSGEMMGGLGIQSEYIAFAGFCTSIGMAAFSPLFYVHGGLLHALCAQLYLCPDRLSLHSRTVQSADGLRQTDASDGTSLRAYQVCFRH